MQRATQCSIVIIEHDMPLIRAVSDEIIALDLGRIVMRGTPSAVLSDARVVASYLGGDLGVIQRSGSVPGVQERGAGTHDRQRTAVDQVVPHG
jgi:ABC-type transporter Mla maintaining outer membrane lipid asymmetry ATPase subunit MlaF